MTGGGAQRQGGRREARRKTAFQAQFSLRGIRQAEGIPISTGDAEQFAHPFTNKRIVRTAGLQIGTETEHRAQAFIGRREFFGHQLQCLLISPRPGNQRHRSRLTPSAAQDELVVVATSPVDNLVAGMQDQKQSATILGIRRRQGNRGGKFKPSGVVGDADLNRGGGNSDA